MDHTETNAHAGMSLSPADDTKTAMADFLNTFQAFTQDLNTKFQQQEKRLTMLDLKSHTFGRPALAATSDGEHPHHKAFNAYLRSGDDDGLRVLEIDGKALSTSVAVDGGYLVDPQTSEMVHSVLSSSSSIRGISNIVTVEASSYDVLVDHGELGTGWATEAGATAETTTPKIDRVTIPLHELSALPKASQRLLDDAAFDIENWLAKRIADKFSKAEAGAFVQGDGVDKPTGFLTKPTVENDSWSWGNLGYIATGTDGSIGNGDAIIDLVYALDAQYRANASFVMNSKTAGIIRKLKDSEGRFLWVDNLAAGQPAQLMGYSVLIAEDMPDVASDAHAIAFGDFSAGYTIAERPDLRVLRDPFSAKPHVLFYATKRIGGDVSDYAAIKLLKFSTS